jgi:hypothetical protein
VRAKLNPLLAVLILVIVTASTLAIKLQSDAPQVLGTNSQQEQKVGSFSRFWQSILKFLGLAREGEKQQTRSFEYVVPNRLRQVQPGGRTLSSPVPTPAPSPTPQVRPSLPPLPPLPPTTLGVVANSSAVNSQNLPPVPSAILVKDPVTSTIKNFFEGIYQSFGF